MISNVPIKALRRTLASYDDRILQALDHRVKSIYLSDELQLLE